ncbi:MAG: hypothetical protein IH995_10020 [Proteobacteria bacterium]|nr:hypothetical protein [Pseudomonadota bacterium]
MRIIVILLFVMLCSCNEERGSSAFQPVILLDQGHNNWGWDREKYDPVMVRFLTENGFQVRVNRGAFTMETLHGAQIVKIDNAFPPGDNENWSLPTPSAFTKGEIDILKEWVEGGGSLILVVEHMPFPAAFHELAGAFDIQLSNGFALNGELLGDLSKENINEAGDLVFSRQDGTLADHPVFEGRNRQEKIDYVGSSVGSAFLLPDGAISLLTFGSGFVSLEPEASWVFDSETPSLPIEGWSQGGLFSVGKGKVAILGDNFLFTAPDFIEPPFLENESEAELGANNHQFTLNLLRWLAGEL